MTIGSDVLSLAGKRALVVGGSSGIGTGIAQLFRSQGAAVRVWGTRASAADYAGEKGSDLTGLEYERVDVSDPAAIDGAGSFPDGLDILVLAQGAVVYRRKEFEIETFEPRRSGEDFREVAVWTVERALIAAYEAGRDAGRAVERRRRTPTRCDCPACGRAIQIKALT